MGNNELYHYNIKGSKWGLRRFQYKDGSLTPEGRARYGSGDGKKRRSLGKVIHDHKVNKKRKENLEKARIARAEKKKQEEEQKNAAEERAKLIQAGKIKPKDMTESELNAAINKMTLEKRYKDLMAETRPPAKAVAEGKSFAKKMMDEAIKPAMAEAGKQVLKNFLVSKGEKALGLKKGDLDEGLKALEKEAKRFEYQEKISKAKKNMTLDRDFYEARERKRQEDVAKETAKEAKKQVDEYNDKEAKKREEGSSTYRVHGENLTEPIYYSEGKRKVSGLLSTSLSDSFNSPAVSERAKSGESYATEILDRYGNTLTYSSARDEE